MTMSARLLRIGEVATRAGVNPRTVRYYETVGLLPPPVRAPNGYRRYTPETVDLLSFVRQAQGFGFTLEEIKEVMVVRRRGEAPCAHVRSLLHRKVAELDRKIEDLIALRRRIRRSLAVWGRKSRRSGAVCPNIEATRQRGRG
jgi:DNA-binding transcriptional MerR regulator